MEMEGIAVATGLEREAREVVRNSFPLQIIEPRPESDWAAAYERYRQVAAG